MIIKIVNCPNCSSLRENDYTTIIGRLSIPDKSDFYTTSCNQCKERCVYITKEKEKWIKEMLDSTNYQTWKIKLLENNIKIIYL